eukprot:Sdes_comp16010_c0_seq1m5193
MSNHAFVPLPMNSSQRKYQEKNIFFKIEKQVLFEYRKFPISQKISLGKFFILLPIFLAFLIFTAEILLSHLLQPGNFASSAEIPAEVSVIVPTFHEKENLEMLVAEISRHCNSENLRVEIIIVDDDSQDGSQELVEKMQRETEINVRIITRKNAKGLSSAVLEGFQHAKYETLLVMDADLSHPPEQIASLVRPVVAGKSEFSIGSRYVDGGSTQDWPIIRRVISWGATFLARPLVSVTDPMSGFFSVRKAVWNRA